MNKNNKKKVLTNIENNDTTDDATLYLSEDATKLYFLDYCKFAHGESPILRFSGKIHIGLINKSEVQYVQRTRYANNYYIYTVQDNIYVIIINTEFNKYIFENIEVLPDILDLKSYFSLERLEREIVNNIEYIKPNITIFTNFELISNNYAILKTVNIFNLYKNYPYKIISLFNIKNALDMLKNNYSFSFNYCKLDKNKFKDYIYNFPIIQYNDVISIIFNLHIGDFIKSDIIYFDVCVQCNSHIRKVVHNNTIYHVFGDWIKKLL